jgi:hypothetical protein
VTRATRIGVALVALLGAFIFFLLTVGSLGEPHPDLTRVEVADVLDGDSPAARFGGAEMRISGWYAELDADCSGPTATEAAGAWLEATCPLRVLLPYQPAETVTQAELEANGVRLAAPTGGVFPARAFPGGPNLRTQQLVYVGRFDDPAAGGCATQLRERCRDTFVVNDYDGLLR